MDVHKNNTDFAWVIVSILSKAEAKEIGQEVSKQINIKTSNQWSSRIYGVTYTDDEGRTMTRFAIPYGTYSDIVAQTLCDSLFLYHIENGVASEKLDEYVQPLYVRREV